MISLFLYLPTLAYIPHIVYILALIYILILKKYKNYSFKLDTNIKLILFLIILTLINRIIHIGTDTLSVEDIVPFSVLIIVTYFISMNLSKKDLLYIVYFVVFESLIVLIEFKLGITTFFHSLDRFKEVNDVSGTLLYFFRPMGLSENSSIMAEKIFIAIVLLFYLKEIINKYFFGVMFTVLNLALIATFNRTALVVILLFYIFIIINFYMKSIQNYWDLMIKILIFCVILISIIFFINDYSSLIMQQFDRGASQSDILTGRGAIWKTFFEFIQDNAIFGNGSYKLYLPYYHGGWTMAHAHNSYLEIIATHGIVVVMVYSYLILRNITMCNVMYIVLFFIFSLTQYFLFWGISIQDIIFLYFLIKGKNKCY